MTKPKTIRFWAWVNGAWVRLKVPYGGHLRHGTGGPTDEGFHWEWTEWDHLPNNCIFRTVEIESLDCDGRISDFEEASADIRKLNAVPAYYSNHDDESYLFNGCHIMRPKWVDESRQHRDHEAEKAGY